MPQPLPRFHQLLEKAEDRRKLAKLLVEAGEAPPKAQAGATSGGDNSRLRGLPAIGPGVTGSTVHTDPVWALLAKERRRGR